MEYQKIYRSRGNLERFAAKYGVSQRVRIEKVGAAYVITATAGIWSGNPVPLAFESVKVEAASELLEDLASSASHEALYGLAGRYNLWIEQQDGREE